MALLNCYSLLEALFYLKNGNTHLALALDLGCGSEGRSTVQRYLKKASAQVALQRKGEWPNAINHTRMTTLFLNYKKEYYADSNDAIFDKLFQNFRSSGIEVKDLLESYERDYRGKRYNAEDFFARILEKAKKCEINKGEKTIEGREDLGVDIEKEEDLISQIRTLTDEMDIQIKKLEDIQQRREHAKVQNNELWLKIYSELFENAYFVFEDISRQIKTKRTEINSIKNISGSRSTDNLIKCRPSGLVQLNDIRRWMDYTAERIRVIEVQLENAVCEYMYSCGKESLIETLDLLLNQLPVNRNTALTLVQLTKSYDLFELYNVIFEHYKGFLVSSEIEDVLTAAKCIFEPELVDLLEV